MLGSFKTWKFGKYEAYTITTFQSKPSSQKEIFITLTWFRIILLYNFPGNFSWMIYCPNISISPLLKMSISNGFEKWLLKLKFLTFAKLHILSSNSFIIISINVLKIPTLAGRKRLNTGRVCQNWICNWCSMFVFSSFDILQRFPQNIFITFLFWTENGSKLKSDQNKMFQYLLFSWNANPYPIEVNNDVLIANWSFANIRTVAFAEKVK